MKKVMTDEIKAFFREPNFAHLAMLREDGSPQVAPVWVDLDGDRVIFSTGEDSPKIKAVKRDPRVALSIVRQTNPYSEAYVRGRVVEIRKAGAVDTMNAISQKYIDRDFPFPVEKQITVFIEVDAATTRTIPFQEPVRHRA